MSKKVIVIGAGISGLTTAFWLKEAGCDVTILEKGKEVGGAMETVFANDFLFDRGPNSGLEITPLISEIVEKVGLKDEMIYASASSNKRYILKNDELHPLPMSPILFFKSKLFSAKAKLRICFEPFIGRSKDGYYQSIAQFVARRLGKEFLDNAIDPFVSGVYAGDPERLSVKSSFPKLYELEEKYGGLIIGTIKGMRERKKRKEVSKQSAKMFSFINGMQSFPKAIANYFGEKVLTLSEVEKVERRDDKYFVSYINAAQNFTMEVDAVVSAVPAYVAGNIFSSFGSEAAKYFHSIEYPPVLVMYVGFNKADIGQSLDGFGFLIPSRAKKKFLGGIWSSVIFPNRSNEENASFTIFVGGARHPEIMKIDKEILMRDVLNEFKEIMKINTEPIYQSYRFWAKAIPQYNLGYNLYEEYFDELENKNPGLVIAGNYRRGISVGDCVKNSKINAGKIIKSY